MASSESRAGELFGLWEGTGKHSAIVVGTAKNVGKTTTVNALLRVAQDRGIKIGLTSTGRDGEAFDAVDDAPKPRIFIEAGTLVAAGRVGRRARSRGRCDRSRRDRRHGKRRGDRGDGDVAGADDRSGRRAYSTPDREARSGAHDRVHDVPGRRRTTRRARSLAARRRRSDRVAGLRFAGRFAVEPLIVTVAPVGAELRPDQTPYLPLTPQQLGETAAACQAAGASVIHVHYRTDDGENTHAVARFRDAMQAIRANSDLIVQFSTGGAIGMTPEERAAPLELRPEMATLTCGTVNFGDEIFENGFPLMRG